MLGSWEETQWRQHMEQMSRTWEQALLRTRNNPGQRSSKEPMLLEKKGREGKHNRKNSDLQHVVSQLAKRGSIPRRNSREEQKQTKSSLICRGNVEKAKEDEHLNRPERIHVRSGRRKVSRVHNNEGGNKGISKKIQAIVQIPTPKYLNQIRSLSLKLTAISKFIPKLVELMHPIREVRKALDATNGSG
ncbi:hypothetical protein Tco_0811187 [Tanacetum coccineum]